MIRHPDLMYKNGNLYCIKKDAPRTNITKPIGNLDKDGYLVFGYKNKKLKVARVVWELDNGKIPDGYIIDHIDGNKLNNKIENLRIATRQENNMNRVSVGKSKYKGVSFHKQTGKWQSKVMKDGICHFIGLFEKEEDAAKAYNRDAKRLFGKFALINNTL